MDTCTRDDLRALAAHQAAPCLSLYLPTHARGPEVHSTPARLRSLLAKAQRKLTESGIGNGEMTRFLKPLHEISENALFWRSADPAVAFLVSPQQVRMFRLPTSVKEQVVIDRRFHIRPLLGSAEADAGYFLLALSENQARLFAGSRHMQREIPIPGAPRSLADALRYDEPEKVSQVHSGGNSRSGKTAGVYHGQGDAGDFLKENLSRYFRQVEKSLRPILRHKKEPLILAGVDYHFAIYRELNTYPYLVEKGIPGCPDRLSGEELRAKAAALAESVHVTARQKALGDFAQLVARNLATDDLREILRGTFAGRTKALFIRETAEVWGKYDLASDALKLYEEPRADAEDILNTAAIQCLAGGGAVYTVNQMEMPSVAPAAAVFRY